MLPSCLIGGIAAILIATDSARNSPIITIQYYLYHIANCLNCTIDYLVGKEN